MGTSTLKVLREINGYTQEFIAAECFSINQQDQLNRKITGEQANSNVYKYE